MCSLLAHAALLSSSLADDKRSRSRWGRLRLGAIVMKQCLTVVALCKQTALHAQHRRVHQLQASPALSAGLWSSGLAAGKQLSTSHMTVRGNVTGLRAFG